MTSYTKIGEVEKVYEIPPNAHVSLEITIGGVPYVFDFYPQYPESKTYIVPATQEWRISIKLEKYKYEGDKE